MTQDETALGAALKRAGVDVNVRLMAAATEAMQQAEGDRAKAARVLWERCCADTELRFSAMNMPLELAARDMQGAGSMIAAEKAEDPIPAFLHDKTPGAGNHSFSEKDAPQIPASRLESRAAGASFEVLNGRNAGSPAREPSADRRKALLASHKSAARAANRQFQWLDGLYEPKNGKPLVGMTYGELRRMVNSARDSTRFRVGQTVRAAHIAVVGRKLMEECDAQGVVPDDAVWDEILPQETIDRFEQVWTKDKVGKEFIRYLADSDERTLELFLSKPEALPVHG